MPWIWNEAKNRANQAKHKLSFELAQHVFDDPLAASRPDPCPDEERWQTIGLIGTVVVFVVHTALEVDPVNGEDFGRIISARKATTHERKAYEEGTF